MPSAIKERYGERELIYSAWHREQNTHLSMIDLDAIETCKQCKQPLALIELARDVGQLHKTTTITRKLAEMANIPAYLVFYKIDIAETITSFRVSQVSPIKGVERIMTPGEYEKFLLELRTPHACYQGANSLEAQGIYYG